MWLFALVALQMLVGVLDHDDDRIHHRADGNGNATERHDVGTDALAEHHEECNQHRDRQDDDGHQRTPQVQQERKTHERNDDAFFQQFFFERSDGTINQRSAVVGDGDFHVRTAAPSSLDPAAVSRPV